MDPKLASLDDLYADTPPASQTSSKEPPATADDDGGLSQEQRIDIAATADTFDEQANAAAPDKTKPATAPGKQAAKDAPIASDDDEPEPSDVVGLKAALKATRQKARERTTRAAELEARVAEEQRRFAQVDHAARQMWGQLQQFQQPQQPVAPPDPHIDPEGAFAYRDQQLAAVLRDRDTRHEADLYMAKLVPSQHIMRQKHEDYEQIEAVFADAATAAQQNGDPTLWASLRRHPFPAEYAYQVGKEIQLRQQIAQAGSLDNYVQQLAEARVKEATPQSPSVPTVPANPHAPKAPPPQSLARVPSVTPRNQGKTYQGPTPLNDLYK